MKCRINASALAIIRGANELDDSWNGIDCETIQNSCSLMLAGLSRKSSISPIAIPTNSLCSASALVCRGMISQTQRMAVVGNAGAKLEWTAQGPQLAVCECCNCEPSIARFCQQRAQTGLPNLAPRDRNQGTLALPVQHLTANDTLAPSPP